MISPSLHPEPVRAACERRRRWAFALTPRAIVLLVAGFLLLIPGLYVDRLSYAMPVWEGLVLLACLLDGLRLPKPEKILADRNCSNAPALDSETEIEIAIENQSRVLLDCRIVDDLPSALASEPEFSDPQTLHQISSEPN